MAFSPMPTAGAMPPFGSAPEQGLPGNAPAPAPASGPASALASQAGRHALGMGLLEKAADMMRIAVPLLKGSDLEEPSIKSLGILVRALPAIMNQGQMPHPAAPPQAMPPQPGM